jgi:predicted glycosyltransferase
VKLLFCAAHFGYVRNFESAISALAARGHQVHIAADEVDSIGGSELVERLSAEHPGVTYGLGPSLDAEPWFRLARKLRSASDYVRFHEEAFHNFTKTRLTLRERIPRGVLWLMDSGLGKISIARHAIAAALRLAEAMMPISAASQAFIDAQDPDVVLFASVTAWRVPQIDHLRAARALGRRAGVCVFSWDQLSSKALLRNVPDRVLLWNDTQRREAIEWHGVPANRIVVTGAQCYDQWFGRTPSRDHAAFCRAVGLSAEHPMLLYICSVLTPNPYESQFVLRWLEEIRRSADPGLRDASILVRPHPERMGEWKDISLERFGNVALFGRNPVSPDAQADYFDSLYHSHAVVGLVTSGFLEAAVVGRPVYSLLLPEMQMYQEGMQHFRYLIDVEGGLLKVTRNFPDHLTALAMALRQTGRRDEQNVKFVRAFVRPQGLDVPATPAFVAAVEQLADALPLPADLPPAWCDLAQPLARRLAQSSETGWLRPVLRDTPEMINDRAKIRKAAQKGAAAAARTQRIAEKQRVLKTRRRERRRAPQMDSTRKHLARVGANITGIVLASGSGSAWRKQLAGIKRRVKTLIGQAS